MMQFAEQFPDFGIVSPLTTQLSWPQFAVVLALITPKARLFYLGEAAIRYLQPVLPFGLEQFVGAAVGHAFVFRDRVQTL